MGLAKLILASLFLALSVQSAALPASDLPAGYHMEPLSITGPFGPNGETQTLNGTVQEIYRQANGRGFAPAAPAKREDPEAAVEALDSLEKRGVGRIDCNVGGNANGPAIREGIAYLRRIGSASCRAPRGRGGCSRVSCSYNSAIALCNDYTDRTLDIRCSVVADYAQAVYDRCYRQNGLAAITVHGQVFDSSAPWNVIVKADSC